MFPLRLRLALMVVLVLVPVACLLPPAAPDRSTTAAAVVVDAAAAREAAEGVSAFATDLYAQLRGAGGNLIVSPYSVETALALAAAGAQGDTRAEMEKVLHLPAGDRLAPSYQALAASVTRPAATGKEKAELSVANSLWLQKGCPWKKDYLALARENFRAGLFETDFADPGAASRRINAWVEKETHDRIKDLVPATALNRKTRIVLANAIYFKAKWAAAFRPENTAPEDFTLTIGKKIRAPLVYQKGDYALREEVDLQVLRLPYDGEATAMYVFLPRKADGLSALEEKLTAENLRKWTAAPAKPLEEVKVWLPKFKFTVPTELTDALRRMGVNEAFSSGANFGGMTDRPDGVSISRVIHKAFVELDEAGTEAAAATAVVMAGAAPGPTPAPPPVKEFRADHPFLFVITHEPTGAVLFIGRVEDPRH